MKEGTIFARARDYLDMAEIAFSEEFPKPPELLIALAGLAQAEATRALAQSQRLLAEVQIEANRLKRIELGMAEPGDHTLVGASGEGFTAADPAIGVSDGLEIYKAPELPRTDHPSADSMQSTPPITGL